MTAWTYNQNPRPNCGRKLRTTFNILIANKGSNVCAAFATDYI